MADLASLVFHPVHSDRHCLSDFSVLGISRGKEESEEMKNLFWCETCSAQPLKTEPSAIRHLKDRHSLAILQNNKWNWYSFNYVSEILSCRFCGKKWKLNSWQDKGLFETTKELESHRKTHPKYKLAEREFRCIRELLRFVDERHDIHMGYERGISHKVLFLDGITRSKVIE